MKQSLFKTGVHQALPEMSYSTQAQSVNVEVSRNPASQYLVLDSRNRVQSSTVSAVSKEPWNNFRLQKPQSLMESFATRIGVCEFRFPWFIPNITSNNNKLYYFGYVGAVLTVTTITIPVGFYSPSLLVTAINSQLSTAGYTVGLQLSYLNGQYTFSPPSGQVTDLPYICFAPLTVNDSVLDVPSESYYYNNPSLALTLGMPYENVGFLFGVSEPFSGNYTETLYTQYVDIISNKYNQYTTNLDGNSYSAGSNRLLARVYLADETSTGNNYSTLYEPFIIHRQFKNPKMVMWNKEAVVDWFDISVVDQWNQLVPLPTQLITRLDGESVVSPASYPDFQVTLLATEN
jgi:hypothetical protein